MKTKDYEALLTTNIREFSDMMTAGMKRSVRKHFYEYLLGILIPPEIRRKSIASISDLISRCDQSTINRAVHGVDRDLLEKNYMDYLKLIIGNHKVQFIGDDTILEHPGAKKMEEDGRCWMVF